LENQSKNRRACKNSEGTVDGWSYQVLVPPSKENNRHDLPIGLKLGLRETGLMPRTRHENNRSSAETRGKGVKKGGTSTRWWDYFEHLAPPKDRRLILNSEASPWSEGEGRGGWRGIVGGRLVEKTTASGEGWRTNWQKESKEGLKGGQFVRTGGGT